MKRKTMKVEVKVEVKDREGNLVAVRKQVNDIILNNFKDVLAELLYPMTTVTAGSYRTAAIVVVGGTARDIAIFSSVLSASGEGHNFIGVDSVAYDFGVVIEIGTGTVEPTRDDYKLASLVKYATPTQTVGADYISWAVSIVLDTAADIAEAGLSIRCVVGGYGATPVPDRFMLFRDTFTPVSVPAGGTISVTYTLTL